MDLERKFQNLQQVGPIATTCLTSFTENTIESLMGLAFLSSDRWMIRTEVFAFSHNLILSTVYASPDAVEEPECQIK